MDLIAQTEEPAAVLGENQLNVPAERLSCRLVQRTTRPTLARLITRDGAQEEARYERGLERFRNGHRVSHTPFSPKMRPHRIDHAHGDVAAIHACCTIPRALQLFNEQRRQSVFVFGEFASYVRAQFQSVNALPNCPERLTSRASSSAYSCDRGGGGGFRCGRRAPRAPAPRRGC